MNSLRLSSQTLRSTPLRLTCFACLALSLVVGFGAGGAAAQPISEDTAGCHPPRIRLNLGSLPLAFHAPGSAGGSFEAVSLAGPRLEIGSGGDGRLVDGAAAIGFAFLGEAESRDVQAGQPTGSATSFAFGAEPNGWRLAEPDLSGLLVDDLLPGVDLTIDGDNRRLVWTFTIGAGTDPAEIAWNYSGASILSSRGPLDEVIVSTGAAEVGGWNLRVETPEASTAAGESLDAALVVEGDTVRLSLGDLDPALTPVTVQVTTVYGDWIGDYEAVHAGERIWAVGTADASGTGGDVFVVGLDSDGTNRLSTLLLGGSARDEGRGVAVDATGSIVVAGSTESADLAGTAEGRSAFGGGSDAFVARLSGDGLGIETSRYHGGEGDESAAGVTVGSDGRVSIVGRGEQAPSVVKRPGEVQTVFPTETSGAETYFVASFDEQLTEVVDGMPVIGPPMTGIGIWNDCHDVLTIGIEPHQLGAAMACPATEIINTSYWGPLNATQNKWGDWAMRWVAGFQNRTYTPTCSTPVQTDVLTGDAAILNACQGTNISPVPGSVWLDGTAATAGEQIVGTAMFIDYWNSVTFSRHGTVRMHSGVYLDVLAGGFNSFQDLCNSQGWTTTRGNVIDVVDADCAAFANLFDFNPSVDICQVRQSYWSGNGLVENQFITGTQFKALFDGTLSMSPLSALPYVGDPPVEEQHAVGYIGEFAERMNDELGAVTEVEVTTYKRGKVTGAETAPARVRLSDL